MRTVAKLLLGITTTLPLLYILYFMSMFGDLGGSMEFMFSLHSATMALSLLLTMGLVTHALSSKVEEGKNKLMWALLLMMGNMLFFPIYFYLRIWRQPTSEELA